MGQLRYTHSQHCACAADASAAMDQHGLGLWLNDKICNLLHLLHGWTLEVRYRYVDAVVPTGLKTFCLRVGILGQVHHGFDLMAG